MGTDVHIVLERKKADGKWIGVWASDYFPEKTEGVEKRHYRRFAAWAGLRGDGPEPKGMPDDASELAVWALDEYGEGHSMTWWSLSDAVALAAQTKYDFEAKAITSQDFAWKAWPDDDLSGYRVIFWFDN